jgi:hypothetical protein
MGNYPCISTMNCRNCWNFVMSSFCRSYGVSKIKTVEKFHEIALIWCDENSSWIEENKSLSLNDVDDYFRKVYREWE